MIRAAIRANRADAAFQAVEKDGGALDELVAAVAAEHGDECLERLLWLACTYSLAFWSWRVLALWSRDKWARLVEVEDREVRAARAAEFEGLDDRIRDRFRDEILFVDSACVAASIMARPRLQPVPPDDAAYVLWSLLDDFLLFGPSAGKFLAWLADAAVPAAVSGPMLPMGEVLAAAEHAIPPKPTYPHLYKWPPSSS